MTNFVCNGSFTDTHIFHAGAKYLEAGDIVRSARVCKLWNTLTQDQRIWKNLFEIEGIPPVIGSTDEERDYRKDFIAMYRMTRVSGRTIKNTFGEMIGKVPSISEEHFNKLKQRDPFEKEKSMEENYVCVVVPHSIKRAGLPLALDESGNLTELSKQNEHSENRELTIPFSLKNLKLLSSYLPTNKKNTSIFTKDSLSLVFNQCDAQPKENKVYFIRKGIVGRGIHSYTDHEEILHSNGFEIAPLRGLALFYSIEKLTYSTDLDEHYAINPDTISYCNKIYRSVIGLESGREIEVGIHYCYDADDLGVVPCISVGNGEQQKFLK
ncbi:MAG TPA: F-box protein [Rhabdochlamydiaceae bacterium]|nr:F-box protein [Rhabdochlamydiaceae bacterium]